MSLNIKDPEAHKLAAELAKQTGETMTRAVTQALRDQLERVKRRRKPDATVADLLAIARRCASTHKGKRNDHNSLLYDDHGIPR